MRNRILALSAIAVLSGLLASAGTWLWLSGDEAPAAASALVASADRAADGTMRSGIGVRGHWTIEVRNPDGTLDRREEFDNALRNDGLALREFLTSHRMLRRWYVTLGTTGPGEDTHYVSEPFGQYVLGTQEGNSAFTLKVENVDVGLDVPAWVVKLTGTVVATKAISIDSVWTYLEISSNGCAVPPTGNVQSPLTQHSLPQPIAVLQQQQVLVTVEISFQPV